MSVAESVRAAKARLNRPGAQRDILVFQLGCQTYGIPLGGVKEILPMPLLVQALGQPAVLAGFANLRGTAIPVVRLARLFGLAERVVGRYTPLVVLHWRGSLLAMLVDSVEGVVRIDDEAIVRISDNLCLNNCAEGLVTVGEASFVLLADDRLLREQELLCIDELAATEQARLDGMRETTS